MRTSRALGQILVRSTAEHDWKVPPIGIDALARTTDLRRLPAMAAHHGVVGCVYHSLRHSRLVDSAVAELLFATHHRAVLTHLQVLADLRVVAPALDALGSPWLVVKGPVLAETVYPRPDLRGYTDLDLVVPGTALGAAIEALEANGARVVDENWDLLASRGVNELRVVTRRGTQIDLHWHLCSEPSAREVFRVPMGELYERARRVPLPGVVVPALDPVDALVHLGVHGCLSGANRLVWLKDVALTASDDAMAWDDVVARSVEWGAGSALAVMLDGARAVLGASVPNEVVDACAGSRTWMRVLANARAVAPVERSVGRRSVTRVVARSTRRDLSASTRELARRVRGGLRDPMSRWPANGDPRANEAAGNRREFLRAVATSAHSAKSA